MKDLSGDKTLKYKLSNLPEHVVLQPMHFDLSKPKHVSKLKEILKEQPKQALSLQLRNVTADSLREIIPLCSNIKSLDLINLNIGADKIPENINLLLMSPSEPEATIVDKSKTKYLNKLTSLQLRFRNIDSVEAGTIAKILSQFSSLTTLGVTGASIELSHGAPSFIYVLPHLPNIEVLNLSSNNIKPNGVNDLTFVLPKLTILNLESNYAVNDYGIALADMLSKLPKLRSLNLSRNYIKDTEVNNLAHVFAQLTDLKELSLGSNSMSLNGIKTLVGGIIKSS